MVQNYNNLLDYIKINLGAPLNFLEFSDDDILKYINEHVLPEFTNYCPSYYKIPITQEQQTNYNFNANTYILNVPKNIYVVGISQVIYSNTNSSRESGELSFSGSETMMGMNSDIESIVIGNSYNDMMNSISTIQTFEYIAPCKMNNFQHMVAFDKPLIQAFVELEIMPTDLSNMLPEVYNIFKKVTLKAVIDLVIINRSKYERLSTNVGELNLNVAQLESRKQEIQQEWDTFKSNFGVDKFYMSWL